MLTVDDIRDAVIGIAPNYPIHSVKLFGSYAEGRAMEHSDVDVMIQTARPFTLFDLIGFQQSLSDHLNVAVDVVEEKSLSKSDLIIKKTVELYG